MTSYGRRPKALRASLWHLTACGGGPLLPEERRDLLLRSIAQLSSSRRRVRPRSVRQPGSRSRHVPERGERYPIRLRPLVRYVQFAFEPSQLGGHHDGITRTSAPCGVALKNTFANQSVDVTGRGVLRTLRQLCPFGSRELAFEAV
jgi:hypothetical protein